MAEEAESRCIRGPIGETSAEHKREGSTPIKVSHGLPNEVIRPEISVVMITGEDRITSIFVVRPSVQKPNSPIAAITRSDPRMPLSLVECGTVKRWLFNIATVLSLLLCVATLMLWVRSFWVADIAIRRSEFHVQPGTVVVAETFTVLSTTGTVVVELRGSGDGRFKTTGKKDWLLGHFPPSSIPLTEGGQGSFVSSLIMFRWQMSSRRLVAAFPYAALLALTTVLPLLYLRRYRRSRSLSRAGLCSACGYDLRATPDRCPECGTATASAM